ncbi:MAG: hypothetical protein ACRDAP_07805, partial [Shewanella sp.]
MFPNQPTTPSTTTADPDTSQATQTQLVAVSTATTTTAIAQATVSVANTASQPETCGAGQSVDRQPLSETARFHPYTDGVSCEEEFAGSSAIVAALRASTAASHVQTGGQGAVDEALDPDVLSVYGERNFYPQAQLRTFFDALSNKIGLLWNNEYEKSTAETAAGLGDVGRGAIKPSALSFSEEKINECECAALKELLRRSNEEKDSAWRGFLLIKVLRAFCATYVLWHGVLITFGFLLGMNPKSVQSWYKTLPETPTVVAREARGDGPFSDTAMAAPLSIRLPMDVLSWPEMARFLREQFSMQLAPPEARAPSQAAEANSASESDAAEQRLIMRLSFTESFISRQENELAKL